MIKKKLIFSKLLFLIGFVGAFATPNAPSKIVYEGVTISVYLNLLPKEFYKTDIKFFESVLALNVFGDKEVCWTTACGDGYLTRVIKSIPDWDVIYLKGQLYRQRFTMPIIFSEENLEKFGN